MTNITRFEMSGGDHGHYQIRNVGFALPVAFFKRAEKGGGYYLTFNQQMIKSTRKLQPIHFNGMPACDTWDEVAQTIMDAAQLELERTKTMTNTDKLADCAKIMKNGWTLVNEQGDTVEIGDVLADFRGDKLQVTGQGRPPHKWGSTGRIELEGQEFFPGVVGCKWARSSDVMRYKVTQAVDYLDPNPVITFFEEEWEAIDFAWDCINDAVQWRVDHTPYAISEKELNEIHEQERELVRLEEV